MMALPVVYCYPPAPRQQRRSPALLMVFWRCRFCACGASSAGVGVLLSQRLRGRLARRKNCSAARGTMTEDVAAQQTATTLLPALRRTSGSSPCSVFCKSGFNINLRKRSPYGRFAAISASRDSSPTPSARRRVPESAVDDRDLRQPRGSAPPLAPTSEGGTLELTTGSTTIDNYHTSDEDSVSDALFFFAARAARIAAISSGVRALIAARSAADRRLRRRLPRPRNRLLERSAIASATQSGGVAGIPRKRRFRRKRRRRRQSGARPRGTFSTTSNWP